MQRDVRWRGIISREKAVLYRESFLGYFRGSMKRDIIPVSIRCLYPTPKPKEYAIGWSVFLGNDDKVFVIQVEPVMGSTIRMFMQKTAKERPLTHDLMNHIFTGFGITVERVVITELRNSTFYARMILQQQNELGRKILEVDARPSDCIAIATAHDSPIYVDADLYEELDDMSQVLHSIAQDLGSGGDEGERI